MTPLLIAACLSCSPAPQDELFLNLQSGHARIQYVPAEMSAAEAKQIGQTFDEMWDIYEEFMGMQPPESITLILRLRPSAPMYYYTNGSDKAWVDFPNAGIYRPAMPRSPFVEDLARRIWAQLWLFQHLETTGGLDPRFLESLIGYHAYVLDQAQQRGKTVRTEGPSTLWTTLDTVYGGGTASFLLRSFTAQKMRADQLGQFLRDNAQVLLEDPECHSFFDLVTPARPVYASEPLEPGEPLAQGTTMRPSRMALFNGVRLIGDATAPLSAADRVRDFQSAYSLVRQTYPDRGIASFPPLLNGRDLHERYFEYRPRVERAADNIDYYLVMREFMSSFSDRWINILSAQATALWRGVVGLKLVSQGDHVYVSKVTEGSEAAEKGIEVGMELVEIDGEAVGAVWSTLETFLSDTSSCCSRREARARALNVLLTGAEDRPARLKFLNAEEDFEVELARGAPPARDPTEAGSAPQNFADHVLREDGIGVITVNNFFGAAHTQILRAVEEFRTAGAKGVVVDLRGVDQGNPDASIFSLSLFLQKPLSLGILAERNANEPPGTVFSHPIVVPPSQNVEPYAGKVAVLVDTWTSGASELFALGFRASARGQIFGERTAGAMHQRMAPASWQTLSSSGLLISLSQNAVLDPTNNNLLGLGVEPHRQAEVSSESLAAGSDPVLERAVASLLESP